MATQVGADIQAFRLSADAYQVIEAASCPVLTVPAHRKWGGFERILFPVRPIPGASWRNTSLPEKLLQKNKAELTVLALSSPDEVISIRQLEEEIVVLNLKLAQDNISSQTLFCSTDSIVETVLKKADELSSDLLIITAALTTTTDNLFIGPFTQQIIHNARVPVLAIRPEAGFQLKPASVSWLYGRPIRVSPPLACKVHSFDLPH